MKKKIDRMLVVFLILFFAVVFSKMYNNNYDDHNDKGANVNDVIRIEELSV